MDRAMVEHTGPPSETDVRWEGWWRVSGRGAWRAGPVSAPLTAPAGNATV
jgi:hypothetical protein